MPEEQPNSFSKGIDMMLQVIEKRLNIYPDKSEIKKELYGIKRQFQLLLQDTALINQEYARKEDEFKTDIDSPNYSEELAICVHGKNLIWATNMVIVKCVQLIDCSTEAVANILIAYDKECEDRLSKKEQPATVREEMAMDDEFANLPKLKEEMPIEVNKK